MYQSLNLSQEFKDMKLSLSPNNKYQHIQRLFSAINQVKGGAQQ
jgi:hypothetical protein